MIDLPLGTKATLRFHNAHDEGQALEMLRSAFPGLVRGVLKKKGWRPYHHIMDYNVRDFTVENGTYMVRDKSKDDHTTPQIQLIEK